MFFPRTAATAVLTQEILCYVQSIVLHGISDGLSAFVKFEKAHLAFLDNFWLLFSELPVEMAFDNLAFFDNSFQK